MSPPIISVENLGKSYLVGHQSARGESYTALRDVIGRNFKNFGRKALDMARGRQIIQGDEIEEFWALKDVSFEVNEGEVVGIIGRNGAGKSTLLKVLSRITEPTKGKVTLRGRVASLLEVGTGFHPELTGRENIFLNGAILGMTRREIKTKFDEIVDFAGVEKFLDTPVKRYSSGMYVRLAFAVAAHLDPEILVVDEVLAVGDADFQRKCLSKIKDVTANKGRTVLIVSHNMGSVQSIANRCILLVDGTIQAEGKTDHVIDSYSELSRSLDQNDGIYKVQDENCCLNSVSLVVNGKTASTMQMGDSLDILFKFSRLATTGIPHAIGIGFESLQRGRVLSIGSTLEGFAIKTDGYQGSIRCTLGRLPLNQGRYDVRITVADNHGKPLHLIERGVHLNVTLGDVFQNGAFLAKHHGDFYWRSGWSFDEDHNSTLTMDAST